MKKFIPYIIIFVLSLSLMVYIIIDNNTKINRKIISVSSIHSYLYNQNQLIEIPIFINDSSYPILDKDSYNQFKVVNSDESKLLSLDLFDITYSHEEFYLNESYIKYYFKFKMTNLVNNFNITDAYLKITFLDNSNIKIYIGDLYLNYLEEYNELNWSNIEVKKSNPKDHSLNEIIISLDDYLYNIDRINIYYLENLEFDLIGNDLVIYLPKDKVVSNFPLIIKTLDYTYYLNNTHYNIEYDLLAKSEGLINVYELN